MKKVWTTLILVMMSCIMCFTSAASPASYTYQFENVTIIFDSEINLNENSRNAIAEYLAYGEEKSTTYGLWCSLFGHSYETHSATKITHCVYETDPRCLREIYKVEVCSRCEDTVTELVGSAYIPCCPEE